MNKEDKQRAIGKVIAINSDRFTIELLAGFDNFNISGFDDIHYFAQLNSYVIIPYQHYYIVAEVFGVREKDMNTSYNDPKEQFLNKIKSGKFLEVLPIGALKPTHNGLTFEFGVSVYPSLYTDTLYIKESELDAIFNVGAHGEVICETGTWRDNKGECPHGENRRFNTLSVGKSTIFPGYDVKIDIDKFFGGHAAVLGNTGSGKSCTISSIIQGIFSLKDYSAVGSTFVFFDVNGEYRQAFSKLRKRNNNIRVRYLTLDEQKAKNEKELFNLPNWFLNIDEWALLLKASERTQLPVLRNALGLAVLFSRDDAEEGIRKTKNHLLATCITQILRDETSSPSKSDRIHSILRKFNTTDIKLAKVLCVTNGRQTDITIEKTLIVSFGELTGKTQLHDYLESKDVNGDPLFFLSKVEMPVYEKGSKFNFDVIEEAIDLAILYEEAHGNRQIRDYCSSLITRIKSIRDRPDFEFLRASNSSLRKYKRRILGLFKKDGKIKKHAQVVVIDLSVLDDEIVEIVACVLSRIIYETVKNFEPRNAYPVNLILEEAHRYITEQPQREFLRANLIFDRIAKEGRKFGVFLLVSSQRPSELSKTVLSQCSNFIVHRIQNPEDLSHIRQITPHISETILKRMPSIPTQNALIFGHAVNLPATFKVTNADPLPLSDNNKVSENWFLQKDFELTTKTNL